LSKYPTREQICFQIENCNTTNKTTSITFPFHSSGGVHFNVIHAALVYDNQTLATSSNAPMSVVVKMLNGGREMTRWRQLQISLRHKLPRFLQPQSLVSLVNRLDGYEIGKKESHLLFYSFHLILDHFRATFLSQIGVRDFCYLSSMLL
jgi:hypothetical protein